VAALTHLLQELLEKLGRNSHLPPSSVPPCTHAASARRAGARRAGNRDLGGVTRKPLPLEEVDEFINPFPTECEAAGRRLPR
jgi:hypothetical protein